MSRIPKEHRRGATDWGLLLFLLAVKPFAELTWSVNLFDLAGVSVNGTRFFSTLFLVVTTFICLGRPRRHTCYAFTIVAFLATLALSTGFATVDGSLQIGQALDRILRVASVYLVYLVFTRMWQEPSQLLRLVGIVWLCNLGALLISLMARALGISVITTSGGVERFAGFHHDAASIAGSALVVLVFGVLHQALLRHEGASLSRVYPVLLALTYVSTAVTIAMTLTKAVLVTGLVFVLFWWGFYRRKHYLVLPAVVLVIFVAFSESESLRARFEQEKRVFVEGDFDEQTVWRLGSGRVGVWADSIEYFQNLTLYQQLFGTGLNLNSHNQYICFLLMGGVSGLTLFLIVHFGLVLANYRLYLESRHPAAFIASVLMLLFLLLGLSGAPFMSSSVWYAMVLASLVNAPGMVGGSMRRTRKRIPMRSFGRPVLPHPPPRLPG